MSEEQCTTWGRKRFIEEYQRLAASDIPDEFTRPISGTYDCQIVNCVPVKEMKISLGTGKILVALEKPREANAKQIMKALETGDYKLLEDYAGCAICIGDDH
jgi:hypothetical protein